MDFLETKEDHQEPSAYTSHDTAYVDGYPLRFISVDMSDGTKRYIRPTGKKESERFLVGWESQRLPGDSVDSCQELWSDRRVVTTYGNIHNNGGVISAGNSYRSPATDAATGPTQTQHFGNISTSGPGTSTSVGNSYPSPRNPLSSSRRDTQHTSPRTPPSPVTPLSPISPISPILPDSPSSRGSGSGDERDNDYFASETRLAYYGQTNQASEACTGPGITQNFGRQRIAATHPGSRIANMDVPAGFEGTIEDLRGYHRALAEQTSTGGQYDRR
jgi:hypothetical protein